MASFEEISKWLSNRFEENFVAVRGEKPWGPSAFDGGVCMTLCVTMDTTLGQCVEMEVYLRELLRIASSPSTLPHVDIQFERVERPASMEPKWKTELNGTFEGPKHIMRTLSEAALMASQRRFCEEIAASYVRFPRPFEPIPYTYGMDQATGPSKTVYVEHEPRRVTIGSMICELSGPPSKPKPPSTFKGDIARVFGLSTDAPDEVLVATAKKAWDGVSDELEAARVACRVDRKAIDILRQDLARLKDLLGNRDTIIRRMRRAYEEDQGGDLLNQRMLLMAEMER